MKKRIVVVEDFNTSRQIIKKALEKMGYVVDEASDGREALKFFNGSKIDLVLSDYNMPNMDGAELTKNIRNMDAYKYIPILMLTTETSITKQDRAKEAKITGWIKKPFQIGVLGEIINKAIQ
jgi:two-component system, chemotaxis family, chemotaxis protein CheY